jgi:hypothetical protein
MMLYMPINFGLYPDLEFREAKGLAPDLWVPAADAVNYAVAGVRSGAIPTYQPLSPEQVQQPFVPEDPRARTRRQNLKRFLPIALLVAAGSTWAYWLRKKPRLVAAAGGLWLVVGTAYLARKGPIGFGLLLLGATCLAWAGFNVRRPRPAPETDPA